MEYRKFGNKYFLRIDKGEEVVETLKNFCKEHNIKLGMLTGLGATNRVTIGLFEAQSKKYFSKELTGNHEIAPLYGNITTMNGEIYLHIHVNLGNEEHKSFAGHLNSAFVSATVEVIIDSFDGEVDRKFSEEIGLNLLKF